MIVSLQQNVQSTGDKVNETTSVSDLQLQLKEKDEKIMQLMKLLESKQHGNKIYGIFCCVFQFICADF